MASVFLSYDRDDSGAAKVIATALEKAGHSVWWDLHVRGGTQFSKVIEEALKAADAVVVLWSAESVDSTWVRDEAAAGRDSGRLVPATIDGTEAPLGFRQFQTIDLQDWKRGAKSRGYKEVEQAIGDMATEPSTIGTPERPTPKPGDARRPWGLVIPALVAVLLVGGLAAWWFTGRASATPVVAVVPADQSQGSQAIARDLLAKLGSLQAARTDAVDLIGSGGSNVPSATLIFQAAASGSGSSAGGNLVLLAGRERSVLWSKDFTSTGSNQTALEQSMAYTAGQVLDCALQASAPSAQLDKQTLKLFLNGCALFAERYRSDSASVIPIFSQIISAAPRFQPAWSRLLLAEAQNTRAQVMFYDRFAPGDLAAHIREARRLDPEMPEAYVAEAALLPIDAYEQRSRLFDRAVSLNPDNPDLRIVRSELLGSVGRNNDAVDDARRATELNPLSPGFRSQFIQTLAYSNHLQAAEAELRSAEELWPGSPTIEDARFRLHSRYGDAKDALAMVRSPDFHQYYPTQDMEPYLQARIDPTYANVQVAVAAVQSAQLAPTRKLVQMTQVLVDFGRNDELYGMLAKLPTNQLRMLSQIFYRPNFRQFRHDSRFLQLENRAGLIDFWRKTDKWPDFCSEPDLPYDCRKEAAKLQ